MHSGCTVTSVERILDVPHSVDDESGEQNPCSVNHAAGKFKWEVRGYKTIDDDKNGATLDFCYRAPTVVLATGAYDCPQLLAVPGEHLPHVWHSSKNLATLALERGTAEPVLVVGAGLSAADAVLHALDLGLPVVHIYRRATAMPSPMLAALPAAVYPEYRHVYDLMSGSASDDSYHGYPEHTVMEFKADGKVLLRPATGTTDIVVEVSVAMVLIGSSPDLSFLPQHGQNLAIMQGEL